MYRWQQKSSLKRFEKAWHLKVLSVVTAQGRRPWLYLLVWSSVKPYLAPLKSIFFHTASSAGFLAALLEKGKGNPVALHAEFYQSAYGTSSCTGHDFCYLQHPTREILSRYPGMCPLSAGEEADLFLTLLPLFLQSRQHTVFPLVQNKNISLFLTLVEMQRSQTSPCFTFTH